MFIYGPSSERNFFSFLHWLISLLYTNLKLRSNISGLVSLRARRLQINLNRTIGFFPHVNISSFNQNRSETTAKPSNVFFQLYICSFKLELILNYTQTERLVSLFRVLSFEPNRFEITPEWFLYHVYIWSFELHRFETPTKQMVSLFIY